MPAALLEAILFPYVYMVDLSSGIADLGVKQPFNGGNFSLAIACYDELGPEPIGRTLRPFRGHAAIPELNNQGTSQRACIPLSATVEISGINTSTRTKMILTKPLTVQM